MPKPPTSQPASESYNMSHYMRDNKPLTNRSNIVSPASFVNIQTDINKQFDQSNKKRSEMGALSNKVSFDNRFSNPVQHPFMLSKNDPTIQDMEETTNREVKTEIRNPMMSNKVKFVNGQEEVSEEEQS